MKIRVYIIVLLVLCIFPIGKIQAAELLVEAESFTTKGGWKVDQQFMDLMGSPYLLAHGIGKPVEDAFKEVIFPEKGDYP